ncbi:hypothetical protein PVAND_008815 [Polypedilum vanderplanki]|uniref:DNA polymerase delta subunit OB-fold domain-containing protein n=1 Tax=Polypedilum vanderplanki TaxID=319348 RepID=A0A9J6CBX7_POLVA|nr:hypothetical protein PVAND_008815 [Polypedilum vanderplanki]
MPSILREIAKENQLALLPVPQDFNQSSDETILEDSIQRIKSSGKINPAELVTGIVSAVLGYSEGPGKFIVDGIIFHQCGVEKLLKVIDNSYLIIFISGIDMANIDAPILFLDLFQQWIYGNL